MVPLIAIVYSAHSLVSVIHPSQSHSRGSIFDFDLKKAWHEWELRGVVFLSLTFQVILIIFGSRRKRSVSFITTIITWFSYLSADVVAIYGIGIITNKITRLESQGYPRDIPLNVFWAPFLLLHLGGPETITAYALADNELWLRHFLSLLTQAGVTLYVILMAWKGSVLSFLTVIMMLAGLFKYAERVWVLWKCSSEQFRDSIPDRTLNYPKVVEEQKLKEAEGLQVVPHEVVEVQETVFVNSSALMGDQFQEKRQLLTASGLLITVQRLFADLPLSFQDRDTSISALRDLKLEDKSFQAAFKVIEIELGFIFDMLYTKAKAIDTWWGLARRVAVMVLSVVALALFLSLRKLRTFHPIDLGLTFLLLGGAIFLEVYALIFLALSDKVVIWGIENGWGAVRFINLRRLLSARRRWSGRMAQFSLLSFSLREKHWCGNRLLRLLKLDETIQSLHYSWSEVVPDELKETMMKQFEGANSKWINRGKATLESFKLKDELLWSTELEFDQSIVVWHIATEVVLSEFEANPPGDVQGQIGSHLKISKLVYQYLMYILVFHPYMLPTGIGRLKFKEAYSEAMKFFDDLKQQNKKEVGEKDESKGSESSEQLGGNTKKDGESTRRSGRSKVREAFKLLWDHMIAKLKCGKKDKSKVREACRQLREKVNTKVNMTVVKEDKSKFMLYSGCQVASQLIEIKEPKKRWEVIANVWVEMLAYAASECKAKYHCQQLGKGGELLTHVWLLMAHFGLTAHFLLPHTPSVAELIVREDDQWHYPEENTDLIAKTGPAPPS